MKSPVSGLLSVFTFLLLSHSPLMGQIVSQDFDELENLQQFTGTPPNSEQVDKINLNTVNSDGTEVFTLAEDGDGQLLRVNKRGRNTRHFHRSTSIEDVPTMVISFDMEVISTEREGRLASWFIGDTLGTSSFHPANSEVWANIGLYADPEDNSFYLINQVEGSVGLMNRTENFTGRHRVTIIANNSGDVIFYDAPDGELAILADEWIHIWIDDERQFRIMEAVPGAAAEQINSVKFLTWNNTFNAVFDIDNLVIGTLGEVPLPVELLSIEAGLQGHDVVLEWETASEKNTSHFTVERSVDGENFQSVGEVTAAGNSQSVQTYSFIDRNAGQQNGSRLYYRLKIIDNDGSYEYSPLSHVALSPATALVEQIYPNPFRESLRIRVAAELDQPFEVELSDSRGTLLFKEQKQPQLIGASSTVRIEELDGLKPGIYFLRISSPEKSEYFRLVKH